MTSRRPLEARSADAEPPDRTQILGDGLVAVQVVAGVERGQRKIHRPDAVFRLPVYMDEEIGSYLVAKAEAKGVELSDLVNDLLRREIEIIETVG